MYPRVTAVVVAQRGGPHLQRVLDALAAQTRQPDTIIAVDCASVDGAAVQLAQFGPTHIVNLAERVPFGTAVAAGLRVTPPTTSDHDWLWLLGEDTAPGPSALEALLGSVEVSPSVAAAGPKLVDWDDPAYIREFGEAMTPFGTTLTLVENELDQAQHDRVSDVLGVSAAGMIVRETLWEKLGGFDPALPVADTGLDLCVRVRLAGFRVVLVPSARVAVSGAGVAGPNLSRKWAVRRRLIRERRAAQLHRRMVYAPGGAVPLHWLSLVPLAFFRAFGRVLRKEPGAVGAELAAAFRVAFAGFRVSAARRRLATTKTVGWAAIAPLRVPFAEARRARALKREAAFVGTRGERRDLDFIGGGGAWVVLIVALVGLGIFFPLFGASGVSGGGLLPLSSSVGHLWSQLGYGWRDLGLGFVGAADPFSAVVAVLGTVSFWQPAAALVGLYFVALPAAALGAWLCATRITDRAGLRAFAAIAWAFAPPLLVALQQGRPSAVIAHVLLPWLFYAGFGAARSWASAGVAALLASAIAACAPSLIPALVIAWVVGLALSGRRFARFIVIPLPAIALFAPLVWQQVTRGSLLATLADPGVPVASRPVPGWELALGFPDGLLGGWNAAATALGLSSPGAAIVVALLLVPLALLAVLPLFLRGSWHAAVALVFAALGFATAVGSTHLSVASSAATPVSIWAGNGLSFYWLGLVGAALLGLPAAGRFAAIPAWVAALALVAVAVPTAIALPLGTSAVSASDGRTVPAVVEAKAATNPRAGTLRLTPQPGGGLAVDVIRGDGETLDQQSTLSSTRSGLTRDEQDLATLGGNLASSSGYDASNPLKALGIDYVLLASPAPEPLGTVGQPAKATGSRAAASLDANALLTPVGTTPLGRLWGFDRGTTTAPPAAVVPANAGGALRYLILGGQALVFFIVLLLAIPTGRGVAPVAVSVGHAARSQRRRRPKAHPRAAVAAGADADADSDADADADANADADAADGLSADDDQGDAPGIPNHDGAPAQDEPQGDAPNGAAAPDGAAEPVTASAGGDHAH